MAVIDSRLLADGRELSLLEMIGINTRLTIGDPEAGVYDDAWCYHDREAAEHALATWDGQGDPEGWYRHIGSARRRRYNADGSIAEEWIQP